MTKGRIVLVPFPFDDFSAVKLRPAVCLTNPAGIHRHIIVAFISSRIPDELLETDLVFDAVDRDFELTGLKVSSVLRLHRLITIPVSICKRELGQLSIAHMKLVEHKLIRQFTG